MIWLAPGEPETIEASYVVSSEILQDGRASYDAAGRMASYTDWGAGGIANANLSWKYDAAGNIRNVNAAYKAINADGSFASYDSTQSYWYKYDALNRMVTTKGVLNGTPGSGTISRGSEGSDIAYDAAGQRATMTTGATPKLETYSYNAMGYLTKVSIQINGGTVRDRATYARDLLGRVTDYVEYDNAGTLVHARGDVEYNKRDQVLLEKTRTKQGSDWIYTHTVNYYTETGAAMAQPANIDNAADIGTSTGTILAFTETKNWKNGSSNPQYPNNGSYSQADLDYADSYVTNLYNWYDSAVQANIVYVNRDGTTNAGYQYDGNGSLIFVDQNGGNRPRDITFVTDAQGRVLSRSEADNNYSQSDPRQRYYRFNGIDMGTIGNNGSDNVDFDASIALRTQAVPTNPGAFRGGATTGTPFADFDMSYDAINGTSEAMVASYYTVRNGDTLATIAQAVWGDASLWYMLAEANGLSGASGLVAGTGLIIPEKGSNFRNSADTFRPYDPQAAIGDTQPGAPKPPKQSNKCGVFGQILVTLVAVAVTIVAAPLGPVAAAMIGSTVSQLYGMAIGVQSKFSFKSVALAGVTAGVAQGLGPVLGNITPFGSGALAGSAAAIGNAAVQGAVVNAATQGVAVATGLQKKFSWTSVAAAGVSAGVGQGIGHVLGAKPMLDAKGKLIPGANTISNYGAHLGTSIARSVANAGVRSLIDGSDFGDNIAAALPDVIGQTLGSIMALGVKEDPSESNISQENDTLNAFADIAKLDPITQDRLMMGSPDFVSVTGNRYANFSASLDDEAGIANLFAVSYRKQQLIDELAGIASTESSKSVTGYQRFDVLDGKKDGYPLESGWASTNFELRVRTTSAAAAFTAGKYDKNVYEAIKSSLNENAKLLEQWDSIAQTEVNKLAFAGFFGPMVIGGGGAGISYLAGGGGLGLAESYLAVNAVDQGQAAGLGFLNGSFEQQSTVGGTVLDPVLGGYGEEVYSLSSAGVALRNLPSAGYRVISSKLRPNSNLNFVDEVTGTYQRFYDEGYAQVWDDIDSGRLTPTKGIHTNTFVGQRVDSLARENMREYARLAGWGDDVLRINRRLYSPDGSYTVPDIHLPHHSLILDGSIGIKTPQTPQIIRFQAGAPATNIQIVRPAVVGPRIYIGT